MFCILQVENDAIVALVYATKGTSLIFGGLSAHNCCSLVTMLWSIQCQQKLWGTYHGCSFVCSEIAASFPNCVLYVWAYLLSPDTLVVWAIFVNFFEKVSVFFFFSRHSCTASCGLHSVESSDTLWTSCHWQTANSILVSERRPLLVFQAWKNGSPSP